MKHWNNLKSGFASLMPSCGEAAHAQSEALDHPLPAAKRFGLWLHLLMCQWCRRYGEQIRFLRRAAHEHQEQLTEAVSQKLSPETRDRLKRVLKSDSP